MTDRPLGHIVEDWQPADDPAGLHLTGTWADLQPLVADVDAPNLFAAFAGHDWVWDYLSPEPVVSEADMLVVARDIASQASRPAYVVRAKTSQAALGYMTFYTVDRANGCIEIGNVNLSPVLQRSPVATDAFYLMIDWAFSAGYRRVEWKCNALNAPSRKAAQRLGFSFEGVFRQHLVAKGRNRDTAWFAMTDMDWATLRPAFQQWLSPENFDAGGTQITRLSDLTRPQLFQADPAQRTR